MSGDTNDQIMRDSTEEENKIDVEEASVNLNCVKNELNEDLHVTQYKAALKNILGVALTKRNFEENDNLIGFSDNGAIMENVVIKLEGIKEEDRNFNYCNKCNGDYKGYFLKCSTLSRILNNVSPNTTPESEINNMPMDIVEIRDTSLGKGIFLLKALPKNIIFGPFEGISAVRIADGHGWKMNNKRLENVENGNWMKYISCATRASIKNLDVFQMKGNLYFQTDREIMEGEELLVYYDDEKIQKLDDGQEYHFIPRKQENLPKIFACTLCCLGFQLVKCLTEHKSKCPHAEQNTDIKDFELVECHCCKIWLEKKEHQENHLDYCWEKYLRMSYGHSELVNRNEVNVEGKEDHVNTKAVHKGFKCSKCSYETNDGKNLQKHLTTHKKSFECDICMMNFTQKNSLKRHIQNKHIENGIEKDYQCSDCSYQTNYKDKFQMHLNRHRGIKPFECGICKKKFVTKHELESHIKNKHILNGCAKAYHCSECPYQTNYKHIFECHVNGHRGIQFECVICNMKYTQKSSLQRHIKNNHAENGCAKQYQCSDCKYQTNHKQAYQGHLNRHRDIKSFECGVCKIKFTQKVNLKTHMKNKHAENGCAKDYQCSQCTYKTNYKREYQNHLNRHRGIKEFECGICKMKFTRKHGLNFHMKNKHPDNGCEKDYQCSECSYQTNHKHAYQRHLIRHSGVKSNECDICKLKYLHKGSLQVHIKKKHRENVSGKD